MSPSKFNLSSLLLVLAVLTIVPINHVNANCVEIPESYKAGECTVKLTWHKETLYEIDYRESRQGIIVDWIQANIYDPMGKSISNNLYTNCRGYPGTECNFTSGLPHLLVVSPQHRREYLQFWYGDLGWNTDPEPMKGPKFLGDDVKDQRPWCGVYSEWVLIPRDGPDGKTYKDDPAGTIDTIYVRTIFFLLRLLNQRSLGGRFLGPRD